MLGKIAACYIRVSTEMQRDEGYSIDAQKERLAAHCVSKNIKDYEFYIDGGFTGSNIDRPEMQRLVRDVKNGTVGAVLVYKLDRLSRSQRDTLYLIEDVFNPHGVDFISLTESMDTSTPMGRAMLGIMSVFAQLERENIRERTRMGSIERAKAGLWMGSGYPPFGYDYDTTLGQLLPNGDAETVRKIYDMYIGGASCYKIADVLGLSSDVTAMDILRRKTNIGLIEYNGEVYKGQHEAIVSPEIYEKAMEAHKERSVVRTISSVHILAGMLYCGKCGAKMRYQKWGKQADRRIWCYSKDKSHPRLVKDPHCDAGLHWASAIEAEVIKQFLSFSFNQPKGDGPASKKSVLDILIRQRDETTKKMKRLYELYAEAGNVVLLESINDLQARLKNTQEQIEAEQERSAVTEKIASLNRELSEIKATWNILPASDRRAVLTRYIDKIVVTGQTIEVFYKLADFH